MDNYIYSGFSATVEAKQTWQRSGQILIVDDEKEICGLLCYLLSREGLAVLTAHDGNTALRVIRLESPDVLLLDLMAKPFIHLCSP